LWSIDGLEEEEAPIVLPERDVVLRATAEIADELLPGARVEDAEAVVVPGDADVAPEGDIRVRAPGCRVGKAVVKPQVGAFAAVADCTPAIAPTSASRMMSRRSIMPPGC
jgi:hypothetical protein